MQRNRIDLFAIKNPQRFFFQKQNDTMEKWEMIPTQWVEKYS